jgi:hypothetical protein
MGEYKEAQILRRNTEANLADLAQVYADEPQKTRVTATVIPAPKQLVERRVAVIEAKVETLIDKVNAMQIPGPPAENKEGLQVGTALRGESKGSRFTLEVLEDGYLCSNGDIYPSLSAAALGVSGNRRSGWVFWKDIHGTSIGELTGRFGSDHSESRTVS